MALWGGRSAARRLSFGYSSATQAAAAGDGLVASRILLPWQRDLVELLQAYAEGTPVDFSQVPIELDVSSDFRRGVLNACRKVPYGQTISYGQLALRAGVPGAARAVGTCMAQNPLPLIVPCHRVTRTGGEIGPYSAPGGTATKRRLLAMEAASSPTSPCVLALC